jgi:hypothetical protein
MSDWMEFELAAECGNRDRMLDVDSLVSHNQPFDYRHVHTKLNFIERNPLYFSFPCIVVLGSSQGSLLETLSSPRGAQDSQGERWNALL